MPGPARPADTSPEVWRMLRARWRQMSPAERLEEALAASADLLEWSAGADGRSCEAASQLVDSTP